MKQASEDPRIGEMLGVLLAGAPMPRAALLGFPCDQGVIVNGGRAGAKGAPAAVRNRFRSLTPDAGSSRFSEVIGRTVDRGDPVLGESLSDAQSGLGRTVGALLTQGTLPVIIGGGHETSFGHFLGYVEAGRQVSIVNLDSHPDVRPLKEGQGHSGSPFRQALEHPSRICRSYTVAGLLPQSAAAAHLDFIKERGGAFLFRDAITPKALAALFQQTAPAVMVSIDMDVVDQAYAPGVSAPARGGITPDILFQFAYLAGKTPSVTSLDIVEVNPLFDIDDATARLAAVTLWHFFRGLSER